MQSNVLSLSVATPIAIPSISPNHASNLVGASTNIELPVYLPAPFLPNSIFILTFLNMDVSSATVATSSGSIGSSFVKMTNTLTFDLSTSLYTNPVSLTSLLVQNVINNVA